MSVESPSSVSDDTSVNHYKNRDFKPPLEVDVYRNLQNGSMSVKAREGKHSGLVVGHCESVVIEDANFHVREKGWRDVQETGKKNVHAVVRGTLVGFDDLHVPDGCEKLCAMYNPKKYRYFVTCGESIAVNSAGTVRVSTSNGIEMWDYELNKDVNPEADAHL